MRMDEDCPERIGRFCGGENMAEAMTEREIKMYSAGYNSAMRQLHGMIVRWAEAKEPHAECTCIFCLKLREIAEAKFEGMDPPKGLG
jgi:hypothetical protein